MNDKLKNYSVNPDVEVWERIQKTMRRKAVRRQAWMAVAGAAVVAIAVLAVVLWPSNDSGVSSQPAVVQVAQVEQPQVAVGMDNQMTMKATEAVSAQSKKAPTGADKEVRSELAGNEADKPNTETTVLMPTVQPVVAQVTSPSVMPSTEVATPKAETATTSVVQEGDVASNVASVEPTKPQTKAVSGSAIDDTILWVPNIFVPGSDDEEINHFRARLNHPDYVINNFRMIVFNRSGNQVFMSNDISTAWDGKFRGREMPQSAYVYVIYYTDKDGLRHQRKGTITLVR